MSWHPGGPVGNPHAGPGFSGRNRQTSKGGPSGVQRSSALQLKENEPLFDTYEHLQGLPRGDSALIMLRKVASTVKPIMRKRGWRVQVLAEFLPPEQNLLGLNINKGYKICIRLRYHNNPDLFLPFEEVVDTMLHELSHNVWGDHDSNFHKLWDELRDDHEALVRRGYTGEGFLGSGNRLGGSGGHRPIPLHEMRQRARASAEKRKAQGNLNSGSGQRLGGTPLHLQGGDIRNVIANQVTRRNTINRGCGSGRTDAEQLSQQSANNTFKTKAEEDDANNRAIAQALEELMEEEETRKLNGTWSGSSGEGLSWSPQSGLYDAAAGRPPSRGSQYQFTEEEQLKWAMQESMQTANVAKPLLPPATSNELQKTKSAPSVSLDSKPVLDDPAGGKRKRPENSSSSPAVAQPIKHEMLKGQNNLVDLTSIPDPPDHASEDQWVCQICTLVNPMQFLVCGACESERPESVMKQAKAKEKIKKEQPTKVKSESGTDRWKMPPPAPKQNESLGWNCGFCGAFMEHKWWTCSACGQMKPWS